MSGNKTVLGLVGSPNPEGRTNQLVSAALDSAAKAGAVVEKIQMSEHVVKACNDCLPWICLKNLKCTYEDEGFELLSEKILNCGALILGAPVYWWDTSGMVKYLILKMFRVFAMSGPLKGLPALGIGIAGGTGNGLLSGLRPVYHFFQMMQMRALDPVPATRFNFDQALKRSRELGQTIAKMTKARDPFASYEERLLWYDNLPYLNESLAGERKLLAALMAEAVPEEQKSEIDGDLARAEILASSGQPLESQAEITKIYMSA
ncbi:MAG: flavodoxin family protein, partial [Deltaproteobacteria bacterium]|nr:flavodoxin family protein [Deltaproteobacteria bacterium]MBW2324711.1 flavodoxin family protein [Deltaproteobacteria bacterium]